MSRSFSLAGAVLFAALLILPSCGKKKEGGSAEGGKKPVVYTTFYPTKYFAERIAGDAIQVVCPVPADQDGVFWQPPEDVVAKYQAADLIILNGADYAKWVLKASLPDSKVVNTAKPFEKDFVTFKNAIVHSHGPAGKHSHTGIDGHTWMDPVNAKIQAGEVLKALKRLLPSRAAEFDANFAKLAKDLDALDAEIKALTAKYHGQTIMASHPAYNYIAKRYGWNVVNLHLDPETMPSDEEFSKIKAGLAEKPAKYILWEAYPKKEIAERFAKELGLTSIEFSPCELLSDEDLASGVDYLSVMKHNLANIRPVFE